MPRKLLIARLGVGTLTIALCAGLPGCNLAAVTDPGVECQRTGWNTTVCPGDDASAKDTAGEARETGGVETRADGP